MTKNPQPNRIITVADLELHVDDLNRIFEPLDFYGRIKKLYKIFNVDDVLLTSSFGTKSVFMLHLLKQIAPKQKVHFIDTTYHFPETLAYKKELTELLDLNIIEVFPNKAENEITRTEEYWKDHPRMCCSINKIVPLEKYVTHHKIWISGLMSYQTDYRSRLRVFEQQGDIIKFHPLIDINEGEFLYYLDKNKLPRHPLEKYGYGSIGCKHCTIKGQGRAGRWSGTGKTECGLHPSYFTKKIKSS